MKSSTIEQQFKLKQYLNWGALAILVCLMLLAVAVAFYQVLIRNLPLPKVAWTEEVARFLNIWIAFIGSAILLDDHISVTFLMRYIPRKYHPYLEILTNSLAMGFCLVTLWGTAYLMNKQGSLRAPATEITMFWFYLPLAICCLVLSVFYLIKTIDKVRGMIL